jgi:hypothetical protein
MKTEHSCSQGLGMGIGLGLTFVPACGSFLPSPDPIFLDLSSGISSHHFAKRRALATGIALSGTSAGATIFPISKFIVE